LQEPFTTLRALLATSLCMDRFERAEHENPQDCQRWAKERMFAIAPGGGSVSPVVVRCGTLGTRGVEHGPFH
jgi:hypothetical protein